MGTTLLKEGQADARSVTNATREQLGGCLILEGLPHALAQIWEIKMSKSFQFPPPRPPRGEEICQASHAGHRVQMPPGFEDLSQWRWRGQASHWAAVQLKVHTAAHLRTSWPAALMSKGSEPLLASSPDMESWANACVHTTAQGINGLIMSRHLTTKPNGTSKDLGGLGILFQQSASSVVAKTPTLGSRFGFEIAAQMANNVL